ncbi:MAG TPA: hypothetical protein VE967_13800 [Gemmatimonadaceae bacterium]|nr:hypothetical protein [Gemmatimonadaceae bacterium]
MRFDRSLRALVLFGVVLTAASCGGGSGDTTSPDAKLIIAVLTGNSQTATVATALTTKPAVKVTDKSGAAKAGVTVTFAVASGGGTITGATQTTGDDGTATVGSWTLGTAAGANTLTASVAGATGSPITFTATGTAAAAATVLKAAGDAISSAAGVAVTAKPTVTVRDQYGNGVSGVAVTFAVVSGGGVATGTSQTTNSSGQATVGSWTLGVGLGANTMTATIAGVSGAVTFTATAISGPLAALIKTAGDNQTVNVGAAVPILPAVRAQDQFGNVISGAGVTFSVLTGGGTITGGSQTTGANGIATIGSWTLGGTAGANTLQASSAGVSVTFTATGTAGFNAAQYVGTYSGTWSNTTFSSTGTGSAVIAIGANNSATVTVNVTGNVLGNPGPFNPVVNGTYTSNGVSFTGTVNPVGNITGTVSANGAISASAQNVNANVTGWTVTGTISGTQIQLTFTITGNFASTGTITLTKQ